MRRAWRAANKRRPRQNGPEVFGRELAALDAGTPVDVILPEVFGGCPRGAKWQHDVTVLMTCSRIDDEVIVEDEPQRPLNHHVARDVLRYVLRVLCRFQRHGKLIGIVGQDAFWGQQASKRRRSEAELLELRRKQVDLEHSGGDPSSVKLAQVERRYVRTHGGIAGSLGKSARTLGRYASLSRAMRLIGSKQPRTGEDEDTEHVVLPRGSVHPYPVWSALRPLPSLTLLRLRKVWGEIPEAEPAVAALPRPAPDNAPPWSSPPPTGPPLSPGAAGAPFEDSAGDMEDDLALAIRELRESLPALTQ